MAASSTTYIAERDEYQLTGYNSAFNLVRNSGLFFFSRFVSLNTIAALVVKRNGSVFVILFFKKFSL